MLLKLLRDAFSNDAPDASRISDIAQARFESAQALDRGGRLSEAVHEYRAILAMGAEHAALHNALANCLSRLGRAVEAIPHYRRTAELKPDFLHAESSVLTSLNYDPDLTPEDIFEAHRAWGRRISASNRPRTARRRSETKSRLRVGYVSPDFKRHPVTYLFSPTLAHHDRNRVEVFCYDNLGARDDVTARLQGLSAWRDVAGLSDDAFADQVEHDAIDILVDLAGHTTHTRLRAFALRAAPVQVSWLGYFNTTGLDAVDYFVTDPHSSPPGQDRYFTEKLVRLPHTRFCYEPPPYAPDVAPLPALGSGHVTFGCFNNLSKINTNVITLWSRVLDAVPASRLVLAAMGLDDAGNVEDVRARFARHGIGGERLELRPFVEHSAALAGYGDIDIALDPFPFGGGLTSLEALWMGVPVVTLATSMICGRQTTSFLRNLGLDTLVADTPDAYVEAARTVAGDVAALAALRAQLRTRMFASPLLDAAAFTRALEDAYAEMWKERTSCS